MRNSARLAFTFSIVLVGTLLMTATKAPTVGAQAQKQAPYFEVDPFWPKPLPNHWVTGSTIGLSVDEQDNVWTIHRPNTVDANFKAADIKASEAKDDEVQPSAEGAAAPSTDMIGACCKVAPPVLVYDHAGNLVRSWGGPGPPYNPRAPPSKQFSTMHCAIVSHDGLVYACDRVNDRIQVFKKDGSFVKEVFIDAKTYRSGSVWDMAFSRDPDQTYIYQANGVDEKVNILLRSTLEVLTSFGDGGRQPGQFFGVHNLATDSKGNLYTAETYTGARVQRFLFKGVRPVTEREQGVPWPQGVR